MVYVTDDGNVVKSTPWGLKRILGFFTGIIYMIIMFCILSLCAQHNAGYSFQTLFNPGMNSLGSRYSRDYHPGSGPRPPTRRLGRPNMGNNVDIPFFGGCSSCAR